MWFFILLLLPLAALTYASWHLWILLPLAAGWKVAIISLCAACFLLLFLDFTGKLDSLPLPLARTAYSIGTSSLIVLLYLVLIFLVLDVARLVRIIPHSIVQQNWITAGAIFAGMFVLMLYGNWNYRNKVRVPLTLKTQKTLPKSYRLVMASDLHLGYHNPRTELARWVDMINAERPDLVLIAGDIVDISVRPLIEEGMAEEFRRIAAPIYACLGNHEYYSGTPAAQKFYADAGIHLLSDQAVEIDSSLVIIGRDDQTNTRRKPLDELVAGVDRSKYVIVLDHHPHHLDRAEQAGIDFQLSGHTHRGQVWPISWVTDNMYECSWGQHARGKTQFYVSSGIGIWGGKFRIGTQSEYIVAELKQAQPTNY